jgi:hypothetical protein
MDYEKHYNLLIEKAITENRTTKTGQYYEKHHIIPKSEGGTNTVENLVLLTAREHFIAHWLLFRAKPHIKTRAYSFWKMCTQQNPHQTRYTPSSRSYQEARQAFTEVNSKKHKGKTLTEEHRKQISERRRGKPTRTGIPCTEETKKAISEANKGKIAWNKGKAHLQKTREAISQTKKGVENPKKWKPVLQLDRHTNQLVAEYPSIKQTAEQGFNPIGIRACCYKNKTQEKDYFCQGFKWVYK